MLALIYLLFMASRGQDKPFVSLMSIAKEQKIEEIVIKIRIIA